MCGFMLGKLRRYIGRVNIPGDTTVVVVSIIIINPYSHTYIPKTHLPLVITRKTIPVHPTLLCTAN